MKTARYSVAGCCFALSRRRGSEASRFALSGFTLVELLVVVAIVAILASLSAAALGHAKGEGRKALCIGNFRQLQLAWQMYTDDNNTHLPVNRGSMGGAGEIDDVPNWVAGQMALKDNWSDNTNTVKLLHVYGGIGNYLADPKVFRCPADKSTARIDGRSYARVRSVAMNDFMGTTSSAPGTSNLRWYATLRDILAGLPVENGFVLIDVHEDSVVDGLFLVPEGQWWDHFPTSRHNGGAAVSFTDGHVISHKWRDPRTYQPVTGQVLYGVMQPGNQDMKWLYDRATAPKALFGH